ncbi:MAG: hypothetical protein WCA35_14080 [Kovacikia sp.]
MADLRGHNPSATREMPSQKLSGGSLEQWICQNFGAGQAKVRSQVRGNNLHILVESQLCPDVAVVMSGLTQALATTPLDRLLPPGCPPIYRVVVYGRQTSQKTPTWTESFYLNQLPQPVLAEQDQKTAAGDSQPRSELISIPAQTEGDGPAATAIVPAFQLARLGQPDPIARYLSSVFSNLGIAVRVRVEELEQARGKEQRSEGESRENSSQNSKPASILDNQPPTSAKRLFVICESEYSPDPLMLAEPIAQRLRELELQGFLDAIVFGQVSGEARREWLVRVDLTPTSDILHQWARWGDVQAITHLLNRLLATEDIRVSAILKDVTLHLTCHSTQAAAPDKRAAIAAIDSTLESLAPQGIQAVTIYGVGGQEPEGRRHKPEEAGTGSSAQSPDNSNQNSKLKTQNSSLTPHASPLWVHWLNLPAKTQPTLALTTLELAQKGSLDAISFLLTRLLNPNLEQTLATGGIRVQLRKKADLLHIMTDAPTCPKQSQVGPATARFLKPLQISGVAGIRVYGRRAGQKRPLWSYGVDFVTSRDRLVPEATPDFAASDLYVDDLLAPPGALVLYKDLPPSNWRSVLNRWLEGAMEKLQRSLIASQLFIPSEPEDLTPGLVKAADPLAEQVNSRNAKVALVWGVVGLLLVVQSEWLLGQVPEPAPVSPDPVSQPASAPTPIPSPQSALPTARPPGNSLLPQLSLQKKIPTDRTAFNSSGFTQSGTTELTESPADKTDSSRAEGALATDPASLPATPFQPKADLAAAQSANPFPTFNSRQLNEKIALYRRYLSEHGSPDVLIIGSSRALRGVDPIALTNSLAAQGYRNVTVYNFGINGATAQVVDLIVRQMLPQEKLPKVILFADGARAFNSGRVDITYNGIVASEGYRAMVAGRIPIPGTTVVAQTAKPAPNPASTEPTSVTEEVPTSLSNSYQILNRELNEQLGKVSLAYTHRDRLKALMRDKLAALLPVGNSLLALGIGMTPTDLSNATSPAASALNATNPVLSDGGIVDEDGFLPLPNRFNPVTYYQKYSRVSGDYDSDYDSFSLDGRQTDAMLELVQFTKMRQIPLIFVNLPLTNDYLDPIRKRHEEEFQQHMLKLSTELGFTYRDLSLAFATQTDYFSDPSHLNRYGAYEVSRHLAKDVMISWQKAR